MSSLNQSVKSTNIPPISCDTFVVVHQNGPVIFGKNSDRPEEEIQDIVYFKRQDHPKGSLLKCTYIEIEQSNETHAVILSKPSWMWGAEMGANEFGVCIGNEAVSTKLESEEDKKEKLLGMDLLRLGLERGKTALEALNVITTLLEKYGQGGPCSNTSKDWTYHNSFLICDSKEAYVLETAGTLWAVEKITGYRNISNCLSIGTDIHLMSDGLKEKAKELGFWSGEGDFHFANCFAEGSPDDCPRFANGSNLLRKLTSDPNDSFNFKSMIQILRNEESGIAMREGMFQTTSSQVSVLNPAGSKRPNVHWFTGTPDPVLSVFKPFIFTSNPQIGTLLVSPNVNTPHRIYSLHQSALKSKPKVFAQLAEIEEKCFKELDEFLDNIENGQASLSEVEDLFKDCAETEDKFYK